MDPASQISLSDHTEVNQGVWEETIQPFIGRWNQLVSQTNWEKGRIIHQWREALVAADAPASEYSDEAWSRRVGSVTGQHVGRLRRVFQRFGQTRKQFDGLFWSHFQASVDWDDAEMWLEGGLQNGWSVSQMRHKRWETMGAVADQKPVDSQIISGELDEDFEQGVNESPSHEGGQHQEDGQSSPRAEGPDFGDSDSPNSSTAAFGNDDDVAPADMAIYDDSSTAAEFVRPFSELGELPEDLAESFESLKLAILHHKIDHWKEISCEDVLSALDALKLMATAPSADNS